MKKIIAVVALVIAAGLLGGYLYLRGPATTASDDPLQIRNGKPAPVEVQQIVQSALSSDAAVRRTAFTPELAATIPDDAVLLKDAKMTIEANTWFERGNVAVATTVLSIPGQPDRRVLLGFVKADGSWQISVVESI